MSTPRRISASRLNAIDQCTMKYYLHEILGLPEKTWPRTHAGSTSHSVLEALARPKHRAHYDAVKAANSIYGSAAIGRLVRLWQSRTKMKDEIVADVDAMCMLAINQTDFLDEGAIRRFDPEHEFNMTLPSGGIVKGYIDRLAQYPDRWVIWDYKSQRERFTAKEVKDSYQSLTYQLYLWKTFGVLAEVRYVLLRHPPTKRTPEKHIQITPPATPAQLIGFEQYLDHMWGVVNSFGMTEAHAGYCGDEGFCLRVCSYRYPMTYLAVVDQATGQTISTHMLDNPPNLAYNQRVEERSFSGCARFN